MIKKLMILLLLTITIFNVNSISKVKATGSDLIVWESYNAFSSYYLLKGTVELSYGIRGFTFTIPESGYHTIDAGGLEPDIAFYDSSDVELIVLDWDDTFGDQLFGTFDLDMELLGVLDTGVPAKVVFLIPQTYSSTPAGYWQYITDEDDFEQYYTIPEDRDYYFTRLDATSYRKIILDNVTIPYNAYSILLDMRLMNGVYLEFDNLYSSYIQIFDEDMNSLDLLYIKSYAFLDSDYIIIDLPFDTYDYHEPIYMKLVLIVEGNNETDLYHANRNMVIDFNKDINIVYFMSQSTLVDTSVLLSYGGIPTEPTDPTPPTGFEFTGWFLPDGSIYDFTTLSSDMFVDNVITINAYFRVAGTASDYGTTDDTPDTGTNIYNVLSAFGFATDVGFIFMYLGLIVLVSVGLVVVKISGFIVLVVDIMITALFMYLGFLPLYVIALVFITLVVGILFYMGGVNSE